MIEDIFHLFLELLTVSGLLYVFVIGLAAGGWVMRNIQRRRLALLGPSSPRFSKMGQNLPPDFKLQMERREVPDETNDDYWAKD